MLPEDPKKDRLVQEQRQLLFRYGGIGMELGGGILGFVLLGYWIDSKWKTGPWGIVIGAVIGCVGGMVHLIRRAMVMRRELDTAAQSPPSETDNDDPPAPAS